MEVPLETLLSKAYNDERRALIGEEASSDYTPGMGRLPQVVGATVTPGAGEPTRGDTVHLDVVDRWGNMLSATPSGGWLHSSPVIPALGWPLGTRAQMFWLEEGLPSSLRPGARPRTTLCPGLALRDGQPYLAWGTPGGDQQEQWALHVFLNHVDRGLNLQEAIDAPDFHTDHLISSFYPRGFARALGHGRGAIRRRRRRGPAPARPRRRGRGPVVARPRHRRRPRARRPAEGRREPARDAGLRRRPLALAVRSLGDPRFVHAARHAGCSSAEKPPRPHTSCAAACRRRSCSSPSSTPPGPVLMWLFENDVGRSEIHNLWDAFFFTTVQLLTVSSQMPNPVTTGGRIVDILLEADGALPRLGDRRRLRLVLRCNPRAANRRLPERLRYDRGDGAAVQAGRRRGALAAHLGGGGPLPRRRGQAPRRDVRHLRAAAERDRRAAHGPRAERLDPGPADPLAPDAGLRHALAARLRPRRHRDAERRREAARRGGDLAQGARPRGVRGARLGAPRRHRQDDHGPVPQARRLARLRARALHDGRRLHRGGDALLRPPLGSRLDLPRQPDRQLVPVPRDGDLGPRGRARRHGRHADLRALPVRGRLRAHRDRDRPSGDDARRRRRRRPSGRRALPRRDRQAGRSSRTSSARCP